jgi:hypothetical protein
VSRSSSSRLSKRRSTASRSNIRTHPDEGEAREWVQDEVDRLRALSYAELVRLRDAPHHRAFTSRTGRKLIGETSVHWDSVEGGPVRVVIDVWAPRRGRLIRSITSDDFIRASDGRLLDE